MSSPVRLPPARWVTQTAAFRRWFGHSKVVDADGKPLVVYHVTRHEFAEFDIKRGDLGAHFGTAEQAREIARYFGVKGQTGARTIPAYLSLRNPLRLDDVGAWSGPALALQLQKLGLLPADLPVSNWSGAEGREAVRQAIMRGGYDGVVYANTREGRGDSYIAFRAEQIKSAIGNRGTFDLDDPNVLFDRDDRPLETVDPAREFARRPRRRAAGLDEFGLRLFGLRSIDDVLPAYRNLALRPVPAFLRDVDAARSLRRELATIDPIASLDDNGNISVGSIDREEGLTRFADERGLGLLIRRRLAGASILAPNPFLEGMGFVRYGPSVTFAASGGKAQGQQNQVVWSRNLQGAMLYDLTPGSPLPRGMYSALQAAVMGLDAKSMTPGDWQVRLKAMVGKNDVKAGEIEWSGVLEWLGLQQGRVAKDAVVEYLRNNGVQVEEVTLRDQQLLDDLTPEQQGDVFRLEELGWEVTADMEDARRVIFVSPDGTDYNAYELQDANDVDDEIKQRALRIADPAQQPAKFGQYQLPGGTNYREVLLTLPAKRRAVRPTVRKLENGRWGLFDGEERIQSFADEAGANRAVFINRGTEVVEGPNYRSDHWDQPNVLAHIRLNDRTDADGKRVLFVEEIQSDWAQQGRKKGFKSGQQGLPAGWTVRRDPAMDAYASGEPAWRAVHPNGEVATGLGFGAGTASEAAEQLGSTMRANEPGVSRAPFVESTDKWVALALKRVLRMAAEGGYDQLAFVTGEQSADRYDMSKQIDAVNATRDGDRFTLAMKPKGGQYSFTNNWKGQAKDLPDVVGKELAEKIAAIPDESVREFRGLDLKVGGEGMRTFYDKIVPKVLAEVAKKVGGGKVGAVRLPSSGSRTYENLRQLSDDIAAQVYGRGTSYDSLPAEAQAKIREMVKQRELVQPGVDITPAMRERIMGGLPLFDRARPKGSIPVPRDILPYWIRTAPQLATAFGRWEAGKITDNALAGAVRAELDKRKDRRERAGDQVRGADWIRKRLVRARRTGELSEREVDLALWLIDQNPAVATDLGISIREGNENSPNGTYNLLTRVVTVFSSQSNEDTATHEILHHTERMMPEDVREGIRKEWLKQLRLAVKNAQASEQQRTVMDWMLEAAEQGNDGLALRLWSLRGQDGTSVQDVLPYKLAAASEFWAVNGAALLRQKAEAGTWVQKAKQWLRELVAKARELLGLPSDAAVLKGLRAVIAGDGTFVSPSMISSVGSDVVRRDETEQTIARRARSAVSQFMAGAVKPTDTIGLGNTPPLLVELGAEPLPLQIQGRTLDKVLRGKHTQQMTAEQVIDALTGVVRPVAVFRDAEGMVVLTRARDRRGNPIIVPIHLQERDGRLTVNRVASAYGLEESIARLKTRAATGQMLYAESTNPEQSTTWDTLFRAEVVQAARDSGRIFRLGDGDVNQDELTDRTKPKRDDVTAEALRRAGYGDALDELMAGTGDDDATAAEAGRRLDATGRGRDRRDGNDLRISTRTARVPGADRPSILAKGLADEFERAGVAALTGKTVTSADDVAALAQVWRDPRYETMRVLYVDDAGKIVHATAVSSRLPDRSAIFPMGEGDLRGGARIRETMREHGATGYDLLHNHPSGDPQPSEADQRATAAIAAQAAGFRGHVVINSNRYAVIDPQGNGEVKRRDFGLDKLLTAAQPSDLLGMPVRNPVDVARIGKAIQRPDMVGVVMQSGTARVRVLAEMPVQLLDNRLKAAGWLRRMATNSGSEAVFLAVPEVPTGARRDNVDWLLDNGFIQSAMTIDGFWKIGRSKEERRNLPKFGRRSGQELLQVEQASSVTDSAAFRRWFGDSKVVDENGEPLVVYHGTAKSFDPFSPSAGRNTDLPRDAQGFFFTKFAEDAAAYATDDDGDTADGANLMPVFLRIDKPFVVERGDIKNHPAYISQDRRAKLEADGFDGVVYGNGTEYVVFRPEQIKSAIGNRGTFDPNDPSILESRGRAHTQSQEFKRWFGDSKVVDADGKPLVVYHGSDADFDVFRYGEEGFHFGTEAQATTVGGKVRPFYLSAKRLFRFDSDLQNWNDIELVAEYLRDKKKITVAEYRNFPGLQEWLESKGYDGYVYPNAYEGGGDSFAVFRPEQIKSATGNSGTFDPADPNILADRTKKRDDVTADVGSDAVRQDQAALSRLKAGASRGAGADIDLWEQGGRADAADPEACESSKWRAAG